MAVIRYTVTGELELVGALHIGSGAGGKIGADESYTDATVVRDNRGQPYIPGSSLRGALRAAVAQLAPSLELPGIRDDRLIERKVKEAIEEWQERQGNAEPDEGQLQDLLDGTLTEAERLFGTVHWASPLTIPDLRARGELRGSEIRHGVGIDRDTGAAQENIKYDFEVLPRGNRFGLVLRCDAPRNAERRRTWLQLLGLALRLLEQEEITLGGRAARGVGQVRLVGVQVYRLDRGSRQALLRALTSDGPEAMYGDLVPNSETWARRALRGEVD